MSAIQAPYGMVGIRRMGSTYNTQGLDANYRIASGYNNTIRFGDVVQIVTSGFIQKDEDLITLKPIGVFLGCEFTTADLNYRVQSQEFPANTTGNGDDIFAYVLDDPDAYFRIQADDSVVQADLGQNAGIVQTATTNQFGKSRNALDASTINSTSTLPLRITGFVNLPSSSVGDAFTDCIVKFNNHQLRTLTGSTSAP